jgi:hypothetical protein
MAWLWRIERLWDNCNKPVDSLEGMRVEKKRPRQQTAARSVSGRLEGRLRGGGARAILKVGMYPPLEFLEVEGLGKIVVGAKANCLLLGIRGAECRNQNNIDITEIAPNGSDQIQPVHPRHIHVGNHQVATMTL